MVKVILFEFTPVLADRLAREPVRRLRDSGLVLDGGWNEQT
jgi:hypothetical protein